MNTLLKQKKACYSFISAIIAFVIILLLNTDVVYAASATVSISSTEITQGGEFDVIVTIKADSNIGAYSFYIEYDSEIIEEVSGFDGGGNGRIQLIYYAPNTDVNKEITRKIKFKAKKPGTSSIKYVSISDDDGVIDFDTADNMSVTSTQGSVKVKAPYVASTDNYLTNLKVEAVKADGSTYTLNLSPAFSKDVTKYNANAVEGVTKLVITADKSDSKATVTMAGRNMDPGDNTTTITVTAEDGSTRKYVIYTFVEKKPETTTKPPEPIKVTIDGTEAYLKDIDKSVKLPEGFEKTEYQYKGEKVIAAKGLVKNLLVMYVAKEKNDDGELYIYDEASDTFYPMSNIQLTQKLYTIVKAPQDLIIPAGFVEATVTIDDQSFTGWSNKEIENIYLIYAMNWNGERGLYYYDTTEKQIIRYFDVTVQTGTSGGVQIDDYNKLLSQNENLKDEINKLKADNNKSDSGSVQLYKYLSLGCCILAIIYLGIIIYLVVSKKNEQTDEDESYEEEDDDLTDDEEDDESEEKDDEIEDNLDDMDDETEDNSEAVNDKAEEDFDDFKDKSDDELEESISDDNDMMPLSSIKKVVLDKNDECENESETNDFSTENDENADMEELLNDFEDIITSQTVAAIEDEEKADQQMQTEQKICQEENTQLEKQAEDKEKEEKAQEEKEQEDKQQKEKVHNDDTKKKVADIMDDDDSSIDSEDLDMVIDELFDDLFD